MNLTSEQTEIVDASLEGRSRKVMALAGTGKTTTLTAIAKASPRRRMLYLAFNRSIAEEGMSKFPPNVECRTAHALAFRHTSADLKGRIGSGAASIRQAWISYIENRHRESFGRIRDGWGALARDAGFEATSEHGTKNVMMALRETIRKFEQSDRRTPLLLDVPGETRALLGMYANGARSCPENEAHSRARNLQESIADLAGTVWNESVMEGNPLPVTHDTYLKVWALSNPVLPVDTVLFDEAQDGNALMLSLVGNQPGATQRIYVGDIHQQIYGWRGAVNAMQALDLPMNPLTQSFRFGEAVARYANRILSVKKAFGSDVLRLRGHPSKASSVFCCCGEGRLARAILCRTNAGVVGEVLSASSAGLKPAVVGGVEGLSRLLLEACKLRSGIPSAHPELSVFSSWEEFVAFSETREGQSAKVLVKLADKYGERLPEVANRLKKQTVDESQADVTISTVHKAKGREWESVWIADDFRPFAIVRNEDKTPVLFEEEANLCYVAATRAKDALYAGNMERILLASEEALEAGTETLAGRPGRRK